jgi:uncharacterized protein involved in exopolysaccharide biosynthesis
MREQSHWEIETPGGFGSRPLGLRDIIKFLFSNFILLAGGVVIGAALGFYVNGLIPRAYVASGNFVVDEVPFVQASVAGDAETQRQLVQTLILSVLNREMRAAVEKRLDLPPSRVSFADLDLPLKLSSPTPVANVRVEPVKNSRMGTIEASSQSPEFAARVVNAILDELQLYNKVGGKYKNLQLSLSLANAQAESLLQQMVEITGQRIKFEQENAELDNYLKQKLPLESFPSFGTDSTLNNLKTQLILVDSEYDNIAATSTRGARLVGKRSEVEALKKQLTRHAERLASGLRSEYEIVRTREKNVQSDLARLRNQIDTLSQSATRLAQSFGDPAQMHALAAEQTDGPSGPANIIVVVDRASPPSRPVRPILALNLFLGAMAGGALGLGLSMLRTLLDNRVKSAEMIEKEAGLPCLATVPRGPSLARGAASGNIFDHRKYPVGLGFLRSHLLSVHDGEGGVIGFTPAGSGRTNGHLVADLAILLAQAEKKTLVIDLNLQAPAIARTLGIKVTKGLVGWLGSDRPPDEFISYSTVRELAVLCVEQSAADIDDLMSRRPLASALPDLAGRWDFILIDAPPILSDWGLMLTLPPGSPLIMTVEYGRTSTDNVFQTAARTRGPRWKIDGVVLLNAPR